MKATLKKITLFTISGIMISCFLLLSIYLIIFFSKDYVGYDKEKILNGNTEIQMFDSNGVFIRENNNFNSIHVRLESLPKYVPESFISIEDKEFYKHKGLNYKRIIKASLVNLKSMKIKEGASTISQQLIKNTHLSNERSYRRKFNEILLTKKLENNFSKDNILECYLNLIYFGNGCYGIENASNFYFNKSAKDLKIEESAVLAGIIKSPTKYSPINNYDNAHERRNLVLREMYKDKKIDFDKLNTLTTLPIEINVKKSNSNRVNTYSESALDEAIEILKMPAKQIAIAQYKIYTFCDSEKQKELCEAFDVYEPNCDYCGVSIDANSGAVEAYTASSAYKVKQNFRQPGSALKPVVVYGPALENGVISTSTLINDEPIDIGGYKPKNILDKNYGYVSVEDAVCKSLNIPAVKVLSYTGIDKSKYYAEKSGIKFNENDTGYSVALGGLTDGVNCIDLAGSYIPFANKGIYCKPKFVSYITNKDGKIIYRAKDIKTTVYREDTAYLMTSVLNEACKTGTSKLLKDCEYEVASKTGTVGDNQETKNKDAWNVSYTSKDINCIWLGNMDNTPIEYAGGNMPVKISKCYFDNIYQNSIPNAFIKPSSVQEIDIDLLEYENKHRVVKANDFTPARYRKSSLFSVFYLPKEESTNFISVDAPSLYGKIINGEAILTFMPKKYITYEIWKEIKYDKTLVQVITGKDEEIAVKDKLKSNVETKYYIIAKIKNFTNNQVIISEKSNSIDLYYTPSGSIVNQSKNNNNKWYI